MCDDRKRGCNLVIYRYRAGGKEQMFWSGNFQMRFYGGLFVGGHLRLMRV